MKAIVKKWGNSPSVRSPASVMTAAGLKLDQQVDIREEAGRVIIEPVASHDYDLATLLAGITPKNVHAEAGFGPAIGQEKL